MTPAQRLQRLRRMLTDRPVLIEDYKYFTTGWQQAVRRVIDELRAPSALDPTGRHQDPVRRELQPINREQLFTASQQWADNEDKTRR